VKEEVRCLKDSENNIRRASGSKQAEEKPDNGVWGRGGGHGRRPWRRTTSGRFFIRRVYLTIWAGSWTSEKSMGTCRESGLKDHEETGEVRLPGVENRGEKEDC